MKFLTIALTASVSVLAATTGVSPALAEAIASKRSFESPYSLHGKLSSHFEPGKLFFVHHEGERRIHEARDAAGNRIAQLLIDQKTGKQTLEAYTPGAPFPMARESENDLGLRITEIFDIQSRNPVIRETWNRTQSLSVEFFDENTGKLLGRCKTIHAPQEKQLIAELYDQKRQWVIHEKTIEKIPQSSKQQQPTKDCHDLLGERIRLSKKGHTNDDLTNTVLALSELSLESLSPHGSIDRHPSLSDEKKLKSRDTTKHDPSRKPSYSAIRIANE